MIPSLRRKGLGVVAVAAALGACGGEVAAPRDQWVVTVATDAPVPFFGDRLLIEVLDDHGQACDGCTRLVGAPEPSSWPVAFGILPPADGRERIVRARLFRGELTGESGVPTGQAYIDFAGILPPPSGDTDVLMELRMHCFGVATAMDLRQTCDPATGNVGPTRKLPSNEGTAVTVGSWKPATRIGCTRPAPEGSVCVPGGAFLLGSSTIVAPEQLPTAPERVTRISPFFLDRDEVSVQAIRTSILAGALTDRPTVRDPARGSDTAHCTYLGEDDLSNDAMPINCVSLAIAMAYCSSIGKRLPTEAEWEYAASNAGAETTYPWGESEDVCGHAVVARGGLDLNVAGPSHCLAGLPESVEPGPVAGGHERDVTSLGIRNLGGNLNEWVAGVLTSYDDPCWGEETGLLDNPSCPPDWLSKVVTRGGDWAAMRRSAEAARRNALSSLARRNPRTGFRCAESL